MIFENPTIHFPASTDAAKEVKKTSNTSGIQLYLNREMNSMNKALGASDNDNKSTGLFESFKTKFSGPTKMLEKAASSGSGIGGALAQKLSNSASMPFKLSL